jgi:hypothetical protein
LKINLDRHGPRPLPNICLLPNPHCFSFPPTFKHDSEPERLTQKTTPTPVQELAGVREAGR